jgi:hypothetical protein
MGAIVTAPSSCSWALLCPRDAWLVRLAEGWRLPWIVEPAGGAHGAYSVVLTTDALPASSNGGTMPEIMTTDHPLWRAFCDRLGKACDFQGATPETTTWRCDGDMRRTFPILRALGCDVWASVDWFWDRGGTCDCTILFNVDRGPDDPGGGEDVPELQEAA